VSTAAFGGLQMVVHVDEIWNLARGGYARSREFLDIESRSVCSACIWSGIFTTNEDELHKEVSMGTIWGEWESVSQ
jgi:hypothetical protein